MDSKTHPLSSQPGSTSRDLERTAHDAHWTRASGPHFLCTSTTFYYTAGYWYYDARRLRARSIHHVPKRVRHVEFISRSHRHVNLAHVARGARVDASDNSVSLFVVPAMLRYYAYRLTSRFVAGISSFKTASNFCLLSLISPRRSRNSSCSSSARRASRSIVLKYSPARSFLSL